MSYITRSYSSLKNEVHWHFLGPIFLVWVEHLDAPGVPVVRDPADCQDGPFDHLQREVGAGSGHLGQCGCSTVRKCSHEVQIIFV